MRVKEYLGIKIDYSLDQKLPEQGMALLTRKGFYKKDYETSPQESYARAATCYSFGDYAFAQRIYDYVSKGWFTFASPVLSNAVDIKWPEFTGEQFHEAAQWLKENVTPDGMPISCFKTYVGDTKRSLTDASNETKWLSMMGGGIGVYFGNRSPDSKSTGVMAHARTYDADTLAFKQTASRRGSMAAYLDINHPEVIAFLEMRDPTGGDSNKKCFNLNHAVNITDEFMEKVVAGKDFELVDPKHGNTGIFLNAREVFEKVLELRKETGEPYIFYTDTANRNKPKQIRNPHYHISQSNLCAEVSLYTSERRTAVCCLSSVNLEKYDEWEDTNMVADLVRMLDNVLEYFVQLAPDELWRAVRSARKERSIGLGTLGWHSYLQSRMIPFESGGFNSAVHHTHIIYSDIKSKAEAESLRLGTERGEAPDTEGSGYRNANLLAIAPNASSSSMVNVSPSIEPWNANAFSANGRAGSFLIKNKHLEKLLAERGQDTESVWRSIITNEGSVQHLDFLTEYEKKVFKTAFEIDQQWVVELAAQRQKYVCQSQSLNIFVNPDISKAEMVDLHIQGWLKGVKAFYYCRAKPTTRAKVSVDNTKPLNAVEVKTIIQSSECLACEG